MKPKVWVPVLVLGGAVAAAVALLATGQRLEPSQPEPIATVVRVLEGAPGPVRLKVHAQGTVEPRTRTALVPEVSGTAVWVSPKLVSGGFFVQGEPLLRIDARDYRATLGRAEATAARASAEHEHAQFDLERSLELESRQLISRSEVEAAMRAARIAEAQLRDAELAVEQAERELDRTEIRAPFTGVVRTHQVDVGQFVSRGNTVADLYAADVLEVRLPIADRQLAYLDVPLGRRGEIEEGSAPEVTLTAAFAGREQHWPARLVRLEAEIDPASRMVYAVARLDAAHRSIEAPAIGLFVQAEIQGLLVDDVVVLPRAALRAGDRVLVVDDEERLRFRVVEVLRVYRDEAYVSAGIAPGERVVISPLQTVVEGMRVEVIRAGLGQELEEDSEA
jgi:RND family efflux transporter MFP subunit